MTTEAEKTESSPPVSALQRLHECESLLEQVVRQKDTRLMSGRILRLFQQTRKILTGQSINKFLNEALNQQSQAYQDCQPYIANLKQTEMEVDNKENSQMEVDQNAEKHVKSLQTFPEIEIFSYLVVLAFLIDQGEYQQAMELSNKAVQFVSQINRRTADILISRIFFFYSYAHERTHQLSSIRTVLMHRLTTAVLQHDEFGQEVLQNLLLHNFLHYNQYDQAEKFRAQAPRTEVTRSTQQYCRYLYYLGRIKTVQLEYVEAKEYLQQSSRKAPNVARGFRVIVNKWLILVRLLLGETPERMEFNHPLMKSMLSPYFEVTQAVRNGDVQAFRDIQQKYNEVFLEDRTVNVIERLNTNVIKAGIKRIAQGYSRIYLKDIAAKIGLTDVDDVEFIVAKAIRDGSIEGYIDHDKGYFCTKESQNIYNTSTPQQQFHLRVTFCMDIHNEAVKAMRFEPNAHKKNLEDADQRKERLAQEQELADSIVDDPEGF